jgi:4-hydroxy-3-methylbut-2-en-1-yl diphosphate reductase
MEEVMDAQPVKIGKKTYFESEMIAYLSATGEPARSDDRRISVHIARHYGFCHGVIRAIRMAFDASEKYAGRRIFLLGQIIHNPYVNEQLRKRAVTILDIPWQAHLSTFQADDVVIVPAFGVSADTMARLAATGCTVVDTACGEVMSVWKRIGRYNAAGFTTIIHGKVGHEETIATGSRSQRYLMVKDLEEARMVAGYIRSGDPAQANALLERFAGGGYSPGFDPARDLQHVGMAAQTTMYSGEFLEVSETIRQAIADRYRDAVAEHFQELDTICSATQERQDAVDELARRSDLVIVVGGYNSSNTTNLACVAGRYVPAYHVQGPGRIARGAIRHQPWGRKGEVVTGAWLPDKQSITIGMTSGASTPDSVLEEVLNEVLHLGNAD